MRFRDIESSDEQQILESFADFFMFVFDLSASYCYPESLTL